MEATYLLPSLESTLHGNSWPMTPHTTLKERNSPLTDGTEVCKVLLVGPQGLHKFAGSAASPTGHICLPTTPFSRVSSPQRKYTFPGEEGLSVSACVSGEAREDIKGRECDFGCRPHQLTYCYVSNPTGNSPLLDQLE